MVKYSKHAAPLNAAMAIAHGHPPAKITTAAALSMNTALTVRLTRLDAFFGFSTGAPSTASDAAPLTTRDRSLAPSRSNDLAPEVTTARRRDVVFAASPPPRNPLLHPTDRDATTAPRAPSARAARANTARADAPDRLARAPARARRTARDEDGDDDDDEDGDVDARVSAPTR